MAAAVGDIDVMMIPITGNAYGSAEESLDAIAEAKFPDSNYNPVRTHIVKVTANVGTAKAIAVIVGRRTSL